MTLYDGQRRGFDSLPRAPPPRADGSHEALVTQGGRGAKWSPDGKLILYLHIEDMDAWVVRPDGAGARFLTAGEPISWTADGGSVVVMRPSPAGDGSQQLWAVPLDGQSPRLILDRTSVAPAWGFDASKLWAPGGVRSIVSTEHTTHTMCSGIVLLDAQGSLQRDHRLDQPLAEFDPPAQASWRPDGGAVLYVQDRAIRLLDLATGESHVIAPLASPDLSSRSGDPARRTAPATGPWRRDTLRIDGGAPCQTRSCAARSRGDRPPRS